ncbi:MAG: ribonuclease H family protein [Candidatus Phytoplasma australasiaticum]|nr:ribonuclease H family protein [Candidatus Phytoplasma australasiaticum]
MVFVFEKFRSYLLGAKVVVHMDHSVLKYLMAKKDAKPRLMRWILLLEEFNFDVIDRKEIENQVADHLSSLKDGVMIKFDDALEINDSFPDERVLVASYDLIPWFADYANYLMSDIVPPHLNIHQYQTFMNNVRKFFWDDPYLFHICADGIIRHYIAEVEITSILKACHSSLVGGHHSGIQKTTRSYNVGITGPPSTKMPTTMPKLVTGAKEKVGLPVSMSSL